MGVAAKRDYLGFLSQKESLNLSFIVSVAGPLRLFVGTVKSPGELQSAVEEVIVKLALPQFPNLFHITMADALEEARKRMIAKRFGGNADGAKTGGKGSMALKAKGALGGAGGDDKKLSSVLKKMQMQPLNGIEEVNIFKSDGNVIHIKQPKIQASIPCNTFSINGRGEEKALTDLLPGIIPQLGPESMDKLREYAAQISAAQGGAAEGADDDDDDDEVPDLVENFEEAAKLD